MFPLTENEQIISLLKSLTVLIFLIVDMMKDFCRILELNTTEQLIL